MKNEYVFWLPAFLIMIMIFGFSSKPAATSTQSSMKIADIVMSVYENITDLNMDESIRLERMTMLDHYVRKGAHVTEYAILAAAIALPLKIRGYLRLRLFLSSVLLAAAYAATDEFHQRFVPGRSGQWEDIVIDTLGAILGAILFLLISRVIASKKTELL